MKKSFLIWFIILLAWQEVSAQQVDNYRQDTLTVYRRERGFYSDPIRSKWRQEVKNEGDAWVLRLYNKKKVLQELITFSDKNLEVRKGAYKLFKDGQIQEEGTFDKGYKVGVWDYYAGKHLSEKVNYAWDKKYGVSISYWDNGEVKTKKNYINDVKTGEWKSFYKDGKLALHEIYDQNGKLEAGKYYNPEGKEVDASFVAKALAL
ncbi:MAG: hypothetical protein EOO90_01045 [Pedobacter sp.]|nr:MAG: hypothetical protein EOO90_01045 [Pedobacter sp.]